MAWFVIVFALGVEERDMFWNACNHIFCVLVYMNFSCMIKQKVRMKTCCEWIWRLFVEGTLTYWNFSVHVEVKKMNSLNAINLGCRREFDALICCNIILSIHQKWETSNEKSHEYEISGTYVTGIGFLVQCIISDVTNCKHWKRRNQWEVKLKRLWKSGGRTKSKKWSKY